MIDAQRSYRSRSTNRQNQFLFYILGVIILVHMFVKVTHELTLDMIKVQHWKIYSSHYNDESPDIGFEFNKKCNWNTDIIREWEFL